MAEVFDDVLTDLVRVVPLVGSSRLFGMGLVETVGIVDPVSFKFGVTFIDHFSVGEQHVANGVFHSSAADRAALFDTIARGLPQGVTDGIGVASDLVVRLALQVIDSLQLRDALAPAFHYHQSLGEQIRIAARIARFFGADASDAVGLTDAPDGRGYKVGLMQEAVGIAESVVPHFLLRVDLTDRVIIDDDTLVHAIFAGFAAEGVTITAGLALPGAGFTTWVMNTRTAAVSEYHDYGFNSFARMDNRYIGATEEGLFELQGDDDDGDGIIATIRSGFAQWAGAHLHSFKAAYLALGKGEGEFVLRLVTGDGKVYNYTVRPETMRTEKVNMGKGLRSRYFAFELVSTGQDFDLESLEFIPLAAQRRI